jgi:hypothetical protein
VVPPGDETAWTHGAFSGDVKDGFLYGRGAVDMKGGIACGVAAVLDYLAAHGGQPGKNGKGSISFLITGDEEDISVNGTIKLLRWVAVPEVQITAVCDPVRDATNYIDWDKTGLRDSVRKTLDDPNWGAGVTGIRCGRDVAKDIIETYYAKQRGAEKFKSIASYVDFRELLEKEKDLDSVKIMTPDHLHATISLAAMRKHKHVLMHKPLSNRVAEVRMVVDAARRTGVATHLLAWRGPDLVAGIRDAFAAVHWQWVAAAIGMNLVSVLVRSIAWHFVLNEALPPPHPRHGHVFSAFCVGLASLRRSASDKRTAPVSSGFSASAVCKSSRA